MEGFLRPCQKTVGQYCWRGLLGRWLRGESEWSGNDRRGPASEEGEGHVESALRNGPQSDRFSVSPIARRESRSKSLPKIVGRLSECEGLIVRSIADVVEQLCQDFPEDLGIDGSEDAEEASARQRSSRARGPRIFELPRGKEECTVSMLDFQCRFAGIVGLLERAFGPMEILSDDVTRTIGSVHRRTWVSREPSRSRLYSGVRAS